MAYGLFYVLLATIKTSGLQLKLPFHFLTNDAWGYLTVKSMVQYISTLGGADAGLT